MCKLISLVWFTTFLNLIFLGFLIENKCTLEKLVTVNVCYFALQKKNPKKTHDFVTINNIPQSKPLSLLTHFTNKMS